MEQQPHKHMVTDDATEHKDTTEQTQPPKLSPNFTQLLETARDKHLLRKVLLVVLGVFGVGLIGMGVYAYSITQSQIVDKDGAGGIINQVQNIVAPDPLRGEEEDQINVLLLGIGGQGHSGGGLTDTILVLSFQPSTGKVAMTSLPRDLVVEFPSEYDPNYIEYRKINYAHVVGGSELAKEKATEVTGLEMHYYGLVDFNAFKKIVDDVGGIDVYVDNPFTDYQYPDYNYGWQTISFDEGWATMDGETALQFSRSRHGNNGEGSDFARSQRQQKVIVALREELLSGSTILNPATITNILSDLGDHVKTDAEIWEMARFAELAQDIDTENIITTVIDNSPEGVLYSDISSETGAYVLIPNAGLGDFSEVQELTLNQFNDQPLAEKNVDEDSSDELAVTSEAETEEETQEEPQEDQTDEPADQDENEAASDESTETVQPDAQRTVDEEALAAETPTIVVQNATTIQGLATKASERLQLQSVDVAYIGNALVGNQEETIIYDLSNGTADETRTVLENEFGISARPATLPVEGSSVRLGSDIDTTIVDTSVVTGNTDFIIILGEDASTATTAL